MTKSNAAKDSTVLPESVVQRPTLAGGYAIAWLMDNQPGFAGVVGNLERTHGNGIAAFLHIADGPILELSPDELRAAFLASYRGEFFCWEGAREHLIERYFVEHLTDTAAYEEGMSDDPDLAADPEFRKFADGWRFIRLNEPAPVVYAFDLRRP